MKSLRSRSSLRKLALVCVLALVAARPLSATHGRGRNEAPALMARLDSIMARAIRRGVAPGAALAIGHADDEPEIRTYGRIDWAAGSAAVTDRTLFDLASVTKVVATTPAAMLLVQQGRLDLDQTVASYLGWWPNTGDMGRITVRQLLLHTSGLPAGNDLWRVPGDRDARIRHLAEEPLIAHPGAVTLYSDLGMILLGAVVESIAGERLDTFVQASLFQPLALPDTRYLPLDPGDGVPVPLDRIAPTEWAGRRGHLQGVVDDANAYALAGVAGHAGLFSSIVDLARFARLILSATEGEDTDVLNAAVIRSFAADRPDGRRALGWDGAGSSGWGKYFSAVSFGHSGYTGTSIWIDPERDIYVVLLTNRVDPSSANQKHLVLRHEISEAVRDHAPVRMALATPGANEADVFAAEVAAARTIFLAPVESWKRATARYRASHADRRHHVNKASGGRVHVAPARGRRPASHASSGKHSRTGRSDRSASGHRDVRSYGGKRT
jgi:CubicO group peptidase (beta-lactamase class C family)